MEGTWCCRRETQADSLGLGNTQRSRGAGTAPGAQDWSNHGRVTGARVGCGRPTPVRETCCVGGAQQSPGDRDAPVVWKAGLLFPWVWWAEHWTKEADTQALGTFFLPFEMGAFTLCLSRCCILEAQHLFDLQVYSWRGLCLRMDWTSSLTRI